MGWLRKFFSLFKKGDAHPNPLILQPRLLERLIVCIGLVELGTGSSECVR
jgi:hypothetical protein